jgi:glycosyltransferase involved in cell wall biosynthesis
VSVSVVIPNHNHGETLELAIVSAYSQGPLEVVVIDDASTDGSVEIARQWQSISAGSVRLVANATKADNWQEAMAREFPALRGETVVFCAADDMLLPGMIAHAQEFCSAPVMFTDYQCLDGRTLLPSVSQGVTEISKLTADEVRQRIRSNTNPTETGIGSAIHRTQLEWLASLHFWRCGPFGDAIGYAAVAALHGAVYVPGAGAAIRVNAQSYGRAITANDDQRRHYEGESVAFLKQAGVDDETTSRLIQKRCGPQ